MSQYFDKDFFKFLLGFLVIIVVSSLIVFLVRIYQTKNDQKILPAAQTANI